ncbi:MAG TPA: hypothetical protein VFZ19_01020 [Solirubrobacterales bacterium]
MEDRVDSWNDDRFDELSRRMDDGFKEMREGFARIDQRFVGVAQEMKEGFEKVATRESVTEVSSRLERFETRLDRLYWAFTVLAVLLIADGIIGSA